MFSLLAEYEQCLGTKRQSNIIKMQPQHALCLCKSTGSYHTLLGARKEAVPWWLPYLPQYLGA